MKTNLSDSEWTLMNCLWEKHPMTITELTAALRPKTGWRKNTVITMLARLEAKGAVSHTSGASSLVSIRQLHPYDRSSMAGP